MYLYATSILGSDDQRELGNQRHGMPPSVSLDLADNIQKSCGQKVLYKLELPSLMKQRLQFFYWCFSNIYVSLQLGFCDLGSSFYCFHGNWPHMGNFEIQKNYGSIWSRFLGVWMQNLILSLPNRASKSGFPDYHGIGSIIHKAIYGHKRMAY